MQSLKQLVRKSKKKQRPKGYSAFDEATKVSPFSSFTEFLEEGFLLNEEDRFLDFDLSFTPWFYFIAQALEQSNIEKIFLIQGSQTGKTTLMMAFLLYISQGEPSRVLWVQSTEEEAKAFIKERLKPYIENYSSEAIDNREWRTETFKVFNARVKVGYATTESSMRQIAAPWIIGDELSAWKNTASFAMKRTRIFEGRRKGLFGTTPPKDGEHHSWTEATAGDFYQWWVPCHHCHEHQPLVLSQLDFKSAKIDGVWNLEKIVEITKYLCAFCEKPFDESRKIEMMSQGKAVCVDYTSGKKNPSKKSSTIALQISSLYSFITTWGGFAKMFIEAKHEGIKSLRTFFTDEGAEPPQISSEGFKEKSVRRYISLSRKKSEFVNANLYTAGIDVQRRVLYYSIWAWKAGFSSSGHLVQYGIIPWKIEVDGKLKNNWKPLLNALLPYKKVLRRAFIDSSEGLVTSDIYAFCEYYGKPFYAMKDSVNKYQKVELRQVKDNHENRKKGTVGKKFFMVDSGQIKDEIAAAMIRPVDDDSAWGFPRDTCDEFFKQFTNEHKVKQKRGSKTIEVWKPRYAKAPQHYFSTAVYAAAAIEPDRKSLQKFYQFQKIREIELEKIEGKEKKEKEQEVKPFLSVAARKQKKKRRKHSAANRRFF